MGEPSETRVELLHKPSDRRGIAPQGVGSAWNRSPRHGARERSEQTRWDEEFGSYYGRERDSVRRRGLRARDSVRRRGLRARESVRRRGLRAREPVRPIESKKWLAQPLPAVEAAEKKGGEGAVGVEPAVRVLLPLFQGRLLKLGPARTLRGTFSPLAQATRARMVTC